MAQAGEDRQLVVIGAGGHAKVIIACLRLAGWQVVACTDIDTTPRHCLGVAVVGSDEHLPRLRAEGVTNAFCALGANALRERVGDQLLAIGFNLPISLGPGAIVASSVVLGRGVAVLPGAVLNVDTVVGDFAIINTHANIDHDGQIGRAAHIGPGASLAGEVIIGDRAFVATGCAIIPGRRIGSDSLIGAGSVVVRDLPSNVVAFGNPARIRRPFT